MAQIFALLLVYSACTAEELKCRRKVWECGNTLALCSFAMLLQKGNAYVKSLSSGIFIPSLPYLITIIMWSHHLPLVCLCHKGSNLLVLSQVTHLRRSQRSVTRSPERWPTRHTSPVCWTQVQSAWQLASAWTAPAKASVRAPVTSVTWAREQCKGGSSQSPSCCR